MPKRDNIGMTIGDFKIIDVSPEGRYVVQCLVCKRIQTLGGMGAFKKRINKHGKICSIILSNEYGGDFKNSKLKQFYSIWCNLRNRTNNPNYEKWKQYGGRGINSIAFEHFVDFYDTMYESYVDHVNKYGKNNTTIDRIDVNGNYEPSNCRWETWGNQAKNKTNILKFKVISPCETVYYGENLKEFCEKHNLNYRTIISGIHQGTKNFRNGWKIEILK